MKVELNNIPRNGWKEEYDLLLRDKYLSKKYDRKRRLIEKSAYIDEFLPEIKNGSHNILDIGPGPGEFLEVCRVYKNSIIGIDAPSGCSEMGYEYLRLSELMAERQMIPIKYVGFDKLILDGGLPFEDQRFSIINSQGSIEQVCQDYMNGDKEVSHKDAKLISWNEDGDTKKFLILLFLELKRILKVGGVLMIYGNGAKNVGYYNNIVEEICNTNNLEILLTKGKRLHKIRRTM